METETIKYAWLIPSLEKAKKKYRDANREKLKEKAKQYYDAHKNEQEFKEKCRERSKSYYYSRKAQNTTQII